jgi:hypothetical protein
MLPAKTFEMRKYLLALSQTKPRQNTEADLNTVQLFIYREIYKTDRARGGVVVKALRYKPTGRRFDSRWCHWNFSVT